MSYNTRRAAGGAGRQAPTTQVNYHQQPNRPGSQPQQSRNVGYSTTQPPVTYNNPSQGSYSTPAFSTTPPQPPPPPSTTQQKPVDAVQQQQAAPSTPVTAAKPPTDTPTTPALKQEPVTPADTPQGTENGDANGSKLPFWKKRPFVKTSNKVRRARQNAKLRRVLNPKNALKFLNELRPGAAKFQVKEEHGWGFAATVEIDGITFTGHGCGVAKAKVAASERALKYLLLEQLSRAQQAATEAKDDIKDEEKMETDEGDESKGNNYKPKPEDEVPWGSLAAFALHKLFTEWQNEGPPETPLLPPPYPMEKYDEDMGDEPFMARRPMAMGPRGRGFPPFGRGFPRGPPPPGYGPPPTRRPLPPGFIPPATQFSAVNPMHQDNQKPMKSIPDDANQRHPVMLLNQLKPNLVYHESREGEQPRVTFVITIEVDGRQYVGRGKNKKEAKKQAAKAALAPMGIIYSADE